MPNLRSTGNPFPLRHPLAHWFTLHGGKDDILTSASTQTVWFVTNQPVRSELFKDITRIVVKLGTGVLTDSRKQPDVGQMEQLVSQVAEQRKSGKEIVLVSSGAVGAGMGVLGHERRPNEPLTRSCLECLAYRSPKSC